MEAWWAAHRSAAPDLFAREFRDALQYILTTPGAGTPWPTPRRPDLRRVLMPRTKNHLYKAVESLRAVGATVVGIIALVDREEGGAETIRDAGLPLVSVARRADFMG
jgi:hypothetical protein